MPSRIPAVLAIGVVCLAGNSSAASANDGVTYRRVVDANAAAVLVLDLPVSEEMAYVEGTATYPDHLLFSLDGGRRFAPLNELQVLDTLGLRPATAADITTLRWRVPVTPGQRIEVSYRATLR